MLQLRRAARAVLVLLVAACSGDAGPPFEPGSQPAPYDIVDAAHAGAVPGFYFLPPLVPEPTFSGTFDAELAPRVEVCELSGGVCGTVLATYTTTSGVGSEVVRTDTAAEHYVVNWHTDLFALDATKHYRITIYVGSFRLGYADVDPVSTGKELKNVDTNQYIALVDGRTLPIKFRIETGIVASVTVSPATATIETGQTQQFTATLTDLHGNPITAPVTWTTSDGSVATIGGAGLATGVAPGTATVTATSGGASGTATLTVVRPNTPPVVEADAFDAIGNVTVPVSAPGVLANDTDAESDPLQVAAPGTYPTAAGGTVTLNADGSFTYLSAAGFTGTDSFTYAASDGSLSSGTATVTLNVASRVWYVKNDAAATGDGRDASPFSSLKAAEGASGTGETIFLLAGDGTTTGYDEGIVLQDGQALTGQGVGSSITATLNGETVVLLAAGSAPRITRATAGPTVQLATGNTVQGVNVASTAGAGIAGSGFGTLTAGSLSVSATGGPALDLQTGTVAASFGSLSSTGSGGAGLSLVSVAGTLTAAGGSISGAAGTGFDVSGGSADVTYPGSISNSVGRAVSVTGRTGGTLTLSGSISETGTGVLVQNNGGGTIAFTGASKVLTTGSSTALDLQGNTGAAVLVQGGGLSITTTSGHGISATGGGTLQVTGANNTIASTTGRALNVVNTGIGASGLTFRSLSASGGTYGIYLENTGTVNGLQVTGDGATAGSGGTIQNTGTAGISITSAVNVDLSWMSFTSANTADGGGAGVCDLSTNAGCNGAIKLNGVRHVTFDRLAVSGAAEQGINGIDVTHLTLRNSSIQNTGDGAGESGVYISGLFGTAAAGTASSITGTTVSGAGNHNVFIRNSTASHAAPGDPDRLVVSGSTLSSPGSATPSDGISVSLQSTANFQTVVQNSTFSTTRSSIDGIQVDAGGTSTSSVSITGSSFTGYNTAINVSGSGTSNTSFQVASNPTISVAAGNAVNVASNGDSNLRGTITANPSIATTSTGNPGSGIDIVVDQTGSVVVDVNGNTVVGSSSTGFQQGIRAGARNPNTGEADLTIRDNAIASGGAFDFAGAYLFSGNGSAGESNRVCLNLSGNDIRTNSPWGFDYFMEQWTGNAFQLQGFSGDGTNAADVQSFVSSRDTGGAVVEAAGGTTVNYTAATCATP